MKVSIFDLVVGDIVQLNIGDQVSIVEVFLIAYYHFVTEYSEFFAALLGDVILSSVLLVVQSKRAVDEGCKIK